MNPVVCLMGPTGSGKSDAALTLIERFPFEIVSVDSALIYRGMDIGTAKPSAAILAKIPHHLINIREPHEAYSAMEFKKEAEVIIADIIARRKIPLLVGGTMLYFKALQQGLSALPKADTALRETIAREIQTKGHLALHAELTRIDPESARRIHPNDTQRLSRALEIYRLTGKTRSALWQASLTSSPYTFLNIALIPPSRALLHERIEKRFHHMHAQGLIAEVERLMQNPLLDLTKPALRAVGYRQVWHYLQGQCSEAEMIEQAIAATRQLAKRQLTWIRAWQDITACETVEDVIQFIEKIINLKI